MECMQVATLMPNMMGIARAAWPWAPAATTPTPATANPGPPRQQRPHGSAHVWGQKLRISHKHAQHQPAPAAAVPVAQVAADPASAADASDSCPRQRAGLACDRCKAASGGASCRSTFGWDWKVSIEENDRKTSLPGLRMVRGIAAVSEPGVRVVSLWNQSNWPALLQEQYNLF